MLDSDSEPEEGTGKALRKRGTIAKNSSKHEGGAVASAQRYVPPAARGNLMQGEHPCTSPGKFLRYPHDLRTIFNQCGKWTVFCPTWLDERRSSVTINCPALPVMLLSLSQVSCTQVKSCQCRGWVGDGAVALWDLSVVQADSIIRCSTAPCEIYCVA